MIREISAKPKPTNQKARGLFIVCVSGAFLLIMLSTFIPIYKGVVSLVGIILLSLGLLLYTKYVAPRLYYDIFIDDSGVPLLVIRQQTGKKYTTLCRVALYEIIKVEKQTKNQRKEYKTPVGVKKYSYLPTLDPEEIFRITTSGRYERAEILIESGDGFAELLMSYSIEAREHYVEEE